VVRHLLQFVVQSGWHRDFEPLGQDSVRLSRHRRKLHYYLDPLPFRMPWSAYPWQLPFLPQYLEIETEYTSNTDSTTAPEPFDFVGSNIAAAAAAAAAAADRTEKFAVNTAAEAAQGLKQELEAADNIVVAAAVVVQVQEQEQAADKLVLEQVLQNSRWPMDRQEALPWDQMGCHHH
jgi:hypothetical protein